VRLRDFSLDRQQPPALVCTPYALHASNTVDFAAGHSLMETLRNAGLQHLFATDWRSADPTMRYLGIDAYLADLNVLVDELGGRTDLIGVCQGGWMALVYAARSREGAQACDRGRTGGHLCRSIRTVDFGPYGSSIVVLTARPRR
jgi:poly(3-hydroxyalkanoate) synthetase